MAQKKWQDKLDPWGKNPTNRDRKKYFGDNLIKMFQELFFRKCKHHPFFDLMALHIIVGQLPSVKKMRIGVDDNDIDLRISGCLFKSSGSGGGRGFNFISEICKELDMVFRPVTEITDAALIGSVEADRYYDPEEKSMKSTVKVIPGVLNPNMLDGEPPINIVAMNEASLLFDGKQSDYKKNAMIYYQIALNPMYTADNLLAKKLSKGPWVEFHPICSLCLQSYPPESLYETIIRKGFLQRMWIIYDEVSSDIREETSISLTKLIGKKSRAEGSKEELVKRLKAINQFWTSRRTPTLSKDAEKPLVNLTKLFFRHLENIDEFPRKKLEEFVHRWIEMSWRIAWHHAVLRMSNEVDLEDVAYAKNIVAPLWKDIIVFIEEGIVLPHGEERKFRKEILFIIDTFERLRKKLKKEKGATIPRSLLVKTLADKKTGWGVHRKTANERVKRAEESGIFQRIYVPNKEGKGGVIPMIKKALDPKWM